MATISLCDRCGKRIDKSIGIRHYVEFFKLFSMKWGQYELCGECWRDLHLFINDYKKAGADDGE